MITHVSHTQKMLSLPVQMQGCIWMHYKGMYLRTANTAHMSPDCNEKPGKRVKRAQILGLPQRTEASQAALIPAFTPSPHNSL